MDSVVNTGGTERLHIRRRQNAVAKASVASRPSSLATSETEADATHAKEEDGSVATPRKSGQRSSWSVLDAIALALVGAAVLALVAVAPHFAAQYHSFNAEAAKHNAPVTLWTFLTQQYYLLPLPWRDVEAERETRVQHAQQRFANAQEIRVDGVRSALDAEFARLALDPSFTRYGNTRIFFRPLPRKIYLTTDEVAAAQNLTPRPTNTIARDAHGDAFLTTWGMAEIDPFTNTLNPALADKLLCGRDGQTRMQVMRTQRSMETGVRVYSSYANVKGEEAEVATPLITRGACLARVMELMCAGDKWEIFCPPESSASNATRDAYEHRVDVRHVSGNAAPLSRAEEELDYVARQLPIRARVPHELDEASRQLLEAELAATPRLTRAALLRKAVGR